MTDFQPYQVIKLLKQFGEDNDYKRIFKIHQIKPTFEEIKQVIKVKDLHSFANSIIEIMVGQCEKTQGQEYPSNLK